MSGKTSFETNAWSNDARAIRALAHPMRLRLLDLVRERGPLTATQVSHIVGESPSNVSFHLRTLGHYGYLVEAEGRRGRERPWQYNGYSVAIDESAMDEESLAVVAAYGAAQQMQHRARLARWEAQKSIAPSEWQDADFAIEISAKLSAVELRAVRDAIESTVSDIIGARDRVKDESAKLVEITATGFPFGSFEGSS